MYIEDDGVNIRKKKTRGEGTDVWYDGDSEWDRVSKTYRERR